MADPAPTFSIEDLPPLKFVADGESDEVRQANLEAVLPSPGYPTTVLLMADAISKRADVILLDYTAATVSVRYEVDGIWHSMPSMDRTNGDYMLATLKQMANLDWQQRRERQVGKFTAEYLRQSHKCILTSQGIPSGERVAIEVQRVKPPTESLEDIGMREGMRNELIQAINQPGGLILFSALPGDGLSTTWRAAFSSADRFMRDFFVVEEQSRREPEIINVTPVTYDESQGESNLSVMRALLLREPNVVAYSEIPDAASVNELCRLANEEEITTLSRLHAKHAVEAVMRVIIERKPNIQAFARTLRAVVNQRVIRKLCESCRQAYRPNPNLIAQLGLPPERVPVLYTHFQPKAEELVDGRGNAVDVEPCENCGGPGYFERTGIFELLIVDDRFRQAMLNKPTVQKLAAAAQQSGHISLRDEGIVIVAKGLTSLEELQRVLKK